MVQSILGITCDVKYLDATDAVAIALCHFYTQGSITAKSAAVDVMLSLSEASSRKGAATSMRVGKVGLENIKSSGHKASWNDYVKSNPSRTIRSIKSTKK